MSPFVERMIRAARLDARLYEEVEADSTALPQAMGVVVLSSVAAGIGTAGAGVAGVIVGVVAALVSWFVWALLTYLIGTKLLAEPQTKADLGQLLRTIGFSSSPGAIRVLGLISPLSGLVFLVAGIWMLVAMVVAVRQALDYSGTGRAVAVCLIGFVVQALIFVPLIAMVGAAG